MGEIRDLEPLAQADLDAFKAAAPTATQDLQVVSALFGVDWRKLAVCLLRAVGPLKLARCVLSGGGDWIACLGSIDWEKIIDCAGGALPTGEFDAEGTAVEAESAAEEFK